MLQVTSNWFDGTLHRIVLQENEPDLMLIPMRFNENLTGMADNEIIDKVMERFYRERFEGKFNREAVELVESKVTEINDKVAELDDAITKADEAAAKLATTEKRMNTIIKAVDLPDEVKIELVNSYPIVEVGDTVIATHVYNINGQLMEAIKTVKIDAGNWIGDLSLFKPFLQQTVTVDGQEVEVVAEYVQPTGAHDAYKTGDKVTFGGKIYESTRDGNVWSPTDLPSGWKVIE